jgi:hypothetical protein
LFADSLYLTMNRLRWIFGIPLALSIAIGILILNAEFTSAISHNELYRRSYLYYHAFVNMICFFLFVFLSSLFIPSKRKYAALIAVIISTALAGIGLYDTFTQRYSEITLTILINYAGLFAGILTGIYISYTIFKNKGWDAVKKVDNIGEMY